MQSLNNIISLNQAAEISGYTQDYLGYLIRSGEMKGVKKGGVWFTTEEEIQNYILSQKTSHKKPIVRDLLSHPWTRNISVLTLIIFVGFSSVGFYLFGKYNHEQIPASTSGTLVIVDTTSKVKGAGITTFVKGIASVGSSLANVSDGLADGWSEFTFGILDNVKESVTGTKEFATSVGNKIESILKSSKQFGSSLTASVISSQRIAISAWERSNNIEKFFTNTKKFVVAIGKKLQRDTIKAPTISATESPVSARKVLAEKLKVSTPGEVIDSTCPKEDVNCILKTSVKVKIVGIVTSVSTTLEKTKTKIIASLNNTKQLGSSLTASAGSSLTSVSTGLANGWISYTQGILDNIKNSITGTKEFAVSVLDGAKFVGNSVADGFASLKSSVKMGIASQRNAISAWGRSVPKIYPLFVAETFSNFSTGLANGWISFTEGILDNIRDSVTNTKQFAVSIWNGVKTVGNGLAEGLTSLKLSMKNVWNSTKEFFANLTIETPTNTIVFAPKLTPTPTPETREIIIQQIVKSGLTGQTGQRGIQGPRGLTGLQGIQGEQGATPLIDLSSFVTKSFLTKQVSRIYDSMGNSVQGLSTSLGEEIDTDLLTVSGNTILATGINTTNTLGSGASSINTIGSTTTPGALTLHGAVTLDNNFSQTGANTFGTGTGAVSLNGATTITGANTFTSTGQGIFTKVPTLAHAFVPSWPSDVSNVSDSTLYINPASAIADTNLLGLAVGGVAKFIVDAEGDIYAKNLILTGSTTAGSTTIGTLNVEGLTTLGDAPDDTVTIHGAVTLDNSFSQTGANTFSTGTGAVSLNGATTANTFSSSGATITGGTINNSTIGITTPLAGNFTTIGVTTQGSGAFTTLTTSSTINSQTISATANFTGSVAIAGAVTGATSYNGLVITPNTGEITSGSWHGTVIDADHGGTGQTVYAVGDILYASTTTTLSKLVPNTTITKKFLRETGDGTNGTAPVWDTIIAGDIPGSALTKVDDTNVTLTLGGTPATALLNSASLTLGWSGQLSLARGGTNANLTASNGGIFYSTGTAGAILSGTSTANQILMSGSSTTPAWSTATYPATTTANQLLYSSALNTVGGLSTTARGVLTSNSSGVPVWTALTDGQLIIGSTTGSPIAGSITGTTNQITVTPGSNSITLSIPQSINTTSTPQFARLGLGQAAHATDILSITSTDTTASSKALNITHTGAVAGTGYAGYFSKTGTSTTNVGLYTIATTGTNNYSLQVDSAVAGTNNYTIYANGLAKNYFAGNIGIGLVSPGEKLSVNGNVMIGDETWAQGTTTGDLAIQGNVGIGTTNPTARLEVGNIGIINGLVKIDNFAEDVPTLGNHISGGLELVVGGTGGHGFSIGVQSNGNVFQQVQRLDGTATAYNLLLQPNGGNVGIGTTGPTGKLDIVTLANENYLNMNVYSGNLYQSNTLQLRKSYQSTVGYTATVNGEIYGNITFSGVNVGNTAFAPGATISAIQVGTAGASFNPTRLTFSTSDGTAAQAERMTISNNGNVGIGTTNPLQELEVNGQLRFISATADNNTTQCRNSAGDLAGCTSLLKWKENVNDLNIGLQQVMQLRPVSFDWKSASNLPPLARQDLGFIAEEVELVDPLLARYTDLGVLEGVRYGQMTSLLVKAIQEMNLKVEGLSSLDTTSATSLGSLIKNFLADIGNGVTSIYASVFNAKEKICVDGECLTKEDIRTLLQLAHPPLDNEEDPLICVSPQILVDSACVDPEESSIVCTAPQTLVEGVCVDGTEEILTCTNTQTLVEGVCVENETSVPTCTDTQTLTDGVCVENTPLEILTCTEPEILVDGACVELTPAP